jgi:hypothetical protein
MNEVKRLTEVLAILVLILASPTWVRAQCADSMIVADASGYPEGTVAVPVYGSVCGYEGEDLDGFTTPLVWDTSAFELDTALYEVTDPVYSSFYDEIADPNTWAVDIHNDEGWAVVAGVFRYGGEPDISPGRYRMFDLVFNVREAAIPGEYTIELAEDIGTPPKDPTFTYYYFDVPIPKENLIDGIFTVLGHYGTIRGSVSNAVTSQPIENAKVKAGLDSTTTNASGEYFLDVLVGSYEMICSASGYEPDTVTVAVTENDTTTVDFSLTPHYGSIGGTVTDSEFVPISGAMVSAGSRSDVTGMDGSYQIDSLLIGTYTVTAKASGYYCSVKPGIEVQEGEMTTVDFLLARQGLASPVNLEAISELDSHVPLNWQTPYSGISILIVDDDGSSGTGYADVRGYFTDVLDSSGYAYDHIEVEYPGNGPDSTVLRNYDVVIWFTGETYGNHNEDTITPDDETNLTAYLRSGGRLILSSQDYFKDRYPDSGAFAPGDFPYDYLQIDSTYQDYWSGASTGQIYGDDGSIGEGLCFFTQDPFSHKDGLYVDRLFHRGTNLLRDFPQTIPPPDVGSCALQYDSGMYRVIFTTFPFSGLVDAHSIFCSGRKVRLMHNIIQFLAFGEVGEGGLLLSYNLYREDSPGFEPSPSNLLVSLSPWVTSYDDSAVTNGQTYYYKVTAIYEGGESDPSNEASAMPWVAHKPEPFSLLSPADGDTVWQLSATLTWHQTTDPDPGDTLTYSLFWDTESGFSHPDSLTDLTDTSVIIPDLSDETTYWWKVKAVDTNTFGRWSEETFHFTTYYPEPPEVFGLIYPHDGDTGISRLPTLIWQPAPDPDRGDQVTYGLVYSTHSDFSDSVIISGQEDTIYAFTDSLEPETDYYWKVYASDRFGLATQCETPYHFTTRKEGVLVITSPEVPRTYSLSQNYPNPFNPVTQIRYALPKSTGVKLTIYNILGKEIATLIDVQQEPGYYQVFWDGRDELGRDACSGIYFYRLKAGDFTSVRRMVLIR